MNDKNIYDVIIIGSGPAGLTAGIYTSRANLKTLLLAGEKWGGQLMLTSEVENYPGFPEGVLGPDLMEKMKKQAERFGTKIIYEDIKNVDFSKQPFMVGDYQAKSVIIATGAESIWLGLPNEYRLIGKGVSSCAPCDAPFFKNKKVIVVGGGDAALEEALYLTKFASEVIIAHRRDSFRASKIMQDRVLNHPNIKIMWNSQISDVLGKDKVEGVKFHDGKEIATDGVFVAIGHSPMSKVFAGQVDLDEKGYVKKIHHAMTSVSGIFVAGDVHDYHYRQAITAAGYGCEAALEVERWLTDK